MIERAIEAYITTKGATVGRRSRQAAAFMGAMSGAAMLSLLLAILAFTGHPWGWASLLFMGALTAAFSAVTWRIVARLSKQANAAERRPELVTETHPDGRRTRVSENVD